MFLQPQQSHPAELAPDSATLPKKPQFSAVEARLAALIEQHYDIGTVVGIQKIGRGVINDSYFIEVATPHEQRQFFYRRYALGKEERWLQLEHAVLNHLADHNFPWTAEILPVKAGGSYFCAADENGQTRFHMITEVMPGEDRYAHEKNDLTTSERSSAISALARYHNLVSTVQCAEYAPSYEPTRARMLETIAEKRAELPLLLDAMAKLNSEAVRYAAGALPNFEHALCAVDRDLTSAHYKLLPHLPIHHDYHPGNLRFENGAISGMFDFDFCRVDARVYDVAVAAVFFCTRWSNDKNVDGRIDLQRFNEFLAAYQAPENVQRRDGVAALSDIESSALIPAMQIGNTVLVHWFIRDIYERFMAGDYESIAELDREYKRCLEHRMATATWLEQDLEELKALLAAHGARPAAPCQSSIQPPPD